ncbi:serine/threonine protein kinase, partial [Candidatus Bathyarchaeota archaeon]
IDEVRRIYLEAGLIHGDLSEYNIVVKEDGDFLIIDWPQFVKRGEPGFEFYLRRDLRNLLNFFRKKFGLKISLDDVINYVTGASERLDV